MTGILNEYDYFKECDTYDTCKYGKLSNYIL